MSRPVVYLTARRRGGPPPAGGAEVWGPRLWAELHRRPRECPDPAADRPWLAAFAARVPCVHCRQHWAGVLAALPPDLSSREAYFAWTVAAHNRVNGALGKPQFPAERAAAPYAPAGGG